MWRNVHYDPRKRIIHNWGWDKKGNRTHIIEDIKPYLFVESQNHNDATSIYDTPLKKLEFPSEFDRRRYASDSGIHRLFYNIRVEQQYLLDKYRFDDLVASMSNPLRTFFLDIETYSPNSFPNPERAEHPINLITVWDSLTSHYHTFGLKEPYTPELPNVTYYQCQNESLLLKGFLEYWTSNYPDIVSGWNSEYFDIPYIINRIKKIIGERARDSLSPVGSLYWRPNVQKMYGKDLSRWHIHGMSCIDYMLAYKNFSRTERESYSLNYIAQVELGEEKVAFNAPNLARLSQDDWSTFTKYNIHDVTLLIRLEEKLRFLQIMRMITYKGFTSLESAMGKISVITGAISKEALDQGKILPTFYVDKNAEKENFAGGYVKEVKPGMREAIITFDANSLYPNVLISLNLSPETKIGKITRRDEDVGEVDIRTISGKFATIPIEKFQKWLVKEKIACSKANVLYSQKRKGIIPTYVDGLYAERVEAKNEMMQLENANVGLKKSTREYKENIKRIEQLDILQYTLKILLNSIYGVFANKYAPFYDIDHAASITHTGQAVIKAASAIAEEYIKKQYDTNTKCYVYSDTDSTHLTLKPILDKIGTTFLYTDDDEQEQLTPIVYQKANELNKIINDGIISWAKDILYSRDPRFYFKREAICAVGVYQSKKHYILDVRDRGEDEPIPCNKLKYVGVEVVKSTMSDPVKSLIKRVIEKLIYSKDRRLTNEVYKEVYEEFKKLPLEDLAFRSSINDYNKYAVKADGYCPAKGTPVHVKSALFYNLLLKNFNVDNVYDPIKNGQKIKWFYTISANKYNIKSIAFINQYPKEFKQLLKPDFEKMFEKLIKPATERMYECVEWSMIDVKNQYVCDLFDLLESL